MITLYKTDRQGRIHYYSLNDRQTHLFAPHTITVTWGPVLSSGRERVYALETQKEMDRKLRDLIQRRVDRGYRVLYTFFRNREYPFLQPALKRATVS